VFVEEYSCLGGDNVGKGLLISGELHILYEEISIEVWTSSGRCMNIERYSTCQVEDQDDWANCANSAFPRPNMVAGIITDKVW
jgi:hypothetical protein